jgi:hypothetical protein
MDDEQVELRQLLWTGDRTAPLAFESKKNEYLRKHPDWKKMFSKLLPDPISSSMLMKAAYEDDLHNPGIWNALMEVLKRAEQGEAKDLELNEFIDSLGYDPKITKPLKYIVQSSFAGEDFFNWKNRQSEGDIGPYKAPLLLEFSPQESGIGDREPPSQFSSQGPGMDDEERPSRFSPQGPGIGDEERPSQFSPQEPGTDDEELEFRKGCWGGRTSGIAFGFKRIEYLQRHPDMEKMFSELLSNPVSLGMLMKAAYEDDLHTPGILDALVEILKQWQEERADFSDHDEFIDSFRYDPKIAKTLKDIVRSSFAGEDFSYWLP